MNIMSFVNILSFREAWSRGFLLIIAVALGCFAAFLPAYVVMLLGAAIGLEGGQPGLPAAVVFVILAPWFIGLGSRSIWKDERPVG